MAPPDPRRTVCLTLRWNKTTLEERRRLVSRVRPGGILLFSCDGEIASLKEEIDGLRKLLPHPLLVLADLERGTGQQVAGATLLPPPAALGATDDPDLARAAGLLTGSWMRQAGIDIALAPVLDVQSPAGSAIIGTRAFGSRPERVADLGAAFLDGLRAAGVAGCAKHFPGHGHAAGDTHSARVTDGRPPEAFEAADWIPYRRAIAGGLPAAMAAHLSCPALDPEEPATRSRRIVTGILRERLGFSGAVLSDALTMQAVADLPEGETARRALGAGIDLLLDPADPEALAASLEADAASGRLPREALLRAVRNLDRLAHRPSDSSPITHDSSLLLSLPDRIAERAVTLLRGALRSGENLLAGRASIVLDDDNDFDPESLRSLLSPLPLRSIPSPHRGEGQGEGLPEKETVLFIPCRPRMNKGTAGLSEKARAAIAELAARGVRIRAAVLLGSPWAAADIPDVPILLCTYGSDPASLRAAVRALRGEIPCSGKLPF